MDNQTGHMSTVTSVRRRPVVLVILDGYGVNPSKQYNAVYQAPTPNLDHYFSHYPHTLLSASGSMVGLPDGQMGNSEVGHLTMGAGSVVRQDIVLINDALASGEFYTNTVLKNTLDDLRRKQRPLHLFGLTSDGGVHSHIYHLFAILDMCKRYGVKPLLHMVTDGRDTPPRSALQYLPAIEATLHTSGGAIASIMGRYYAMDRDKRWDRTELAWRALILGKGQQAVNAATAIKTAYCAGDDDEFIRPILLPAFQKIQHEDTLLCFNFRKDRPRQILSALGETEFVGFDRGDTPRPNIVCMMPYSRSFPFPYLFEPERPKTTLGQVVSTLGLAQFHCAETEKYPHVTYFFNGQRNEPYSGEAWSLIPSPKVPTYDLKPQMSAREVADSVIRAMNFGRYAFIVVNFANGDMVGHTAKQQAIIEAVKTLDNEVGRVLEVAEKIGYSVIVTADHGNCEEMVDPMTGEPHTQHTTYPVPCLIMDQENWKLSCGGSLANIAPTVLQLMGIRKPIDMTASSLLLKPYKRIEFTDQPQSLQLKGVA